MTQTLSRSPETPAEIAHEPVFAVADVIRIALVAVASLLVWFRIWEPIARFSVIGIVATLIGGYPVFAEAIENLRERRMTMELSMTIALLAALAINEAFTALIITLFVLIAEVLEGMTVAKGRRAIGDLLAYLPRQATVIRNGHEQVGEISTVRPSDIVLVRPGERIPVDGDVVEGDSFIDQSTITGESMPVEKTSGSTVYAGTINQTGALKIRTARVGRDTSFGKIVNAVEAAEASRAPVQKTADRLAGYLVYFALGAALLTFVLTRNIRSTISVVIVAGACGIAAGTPLALLGAIGRAAKTGAVIKGGLYLEALAKTDVVLLDKTGTVTFGAPRVLKIQALGAVSEQDILRWSAAAERRSEHPIAKAIVSHARQESVPVPEPERFEYQPGKGVVAQVEGNSVTVGNRALMEAGRIATPIPSGSDGAAQVFVAKGNQLIGAITVADEIRGESKDAVEKLKRLGITPVLLTGDAPSVAEAVGRRLGIADVHAELLPDQKAQFVDESVQSGRFVAMVGDGVNDAPALMKAHVGVAMGSGTDVARESANVVLIGNDLSKFVETLIIARRCLRIIMQNFYGTLIVDTVGIVLAGFGLLNPLLAAFIHVVSELAFILNSTRLLPRRNQ